jgi:hypothetical protein
VQSIWGQVPKAAPLPLLRSKQEVVARQLAALQRMKQGSMCS